MFRIYYSIILTLMRVHARQKAKWKKLLRIRSVLAPCGIYTYIQSQCGRLQNHCFRLFDSYRALLVHVRKHQRDVRSQEVVHLVTQRGLAQEFRAPHKVSYRHVKIGIAGRPVGDSCERMRD